MATQFQQLNNTSGSLANNSTSPVAGSSATLQYPNTTVNKSTTPAPTSTSGGGGGGSSTGGNQAAWTAAGHAGTAPVGYGGENAATGSNPNQDAINAQIDSLYNDSYNYLNQAEASLRGDLPGVLGEAQSNFDTNSQLLGNQQQSATAKLGEQTTQAAQNKESALAAARRLYSGIQQGYTQRFGGASSAGGAASEIAGVEQQRQQGQINQSANDTTRQIALQQADVNNNFKAGQLQLEQQKQAAINQANRDFNQKLLEIENNRAQVSSAKAQAKLGALQELRNQVFAIQQQNTQFQQTLELQRNQAQYYLNQYGSQVGNATGLGQTALSQQRLAPQASNLGAPAQQAQPFNPGSALSGIIGNTSTQKYDQYGNPISA